MFKRIFEHLHTYKKILMEKGLEIMHTKPTMITSG